MKVKLQEERKIQEEEWKRRENEWRRREDENKRREDDFKASFMSEIEKMWREFQMKTNLPSYPPPRYMP